MGVTIDATKPGVLVIDGKKFRGKVFHVRGIELELYMTRVLARAVGRGSYTILNWHRTGELPPPLFKVTGTPAQERFHWYSRTQILNLHQAHNRFPFVSGRPQLRKAFFELVNKVFDEGEVIDVGNISISAEIGPPKPTHPRTGKWIATKNAQSSRDRHMAAPVLSRHPTPAATGGNGHRDTQPIRRTVEDDGGYPTGSHPRPEAQKANYRRRPASRI